MASSGRSEEINRMAWECCFLQERHGVISEPSGGSRNEKGEEGSERWGEKALQGGHVALSHCLRCLQSTYFLID